MQAVVDGMQATHLDANQESMDFLKNPVSLGTTIMACQFADGVIVGADSRTTTGTYIANRVTDKLTPVHDQIYCCRSGSAADTQAVADIVRYHLQMWAVQHGENPPVSVAASLFQELCYANKDNLTAGIIIGGWDRRVGPSVYTIPLGGAMLQQKFSIGGSGSTFIYGYCDATYKENMTKDEALAFVRNAVSLAMSRDGSSGGVIRTAVITKDGVERDVVLGDKLPRFFEG